MGAPSEQQTGSGMGSHRLLSAARKLATQFLTVPAESTFEFFRGLRYMTAVLGGLACLSAQRRYWTRTVRDVLARQILFTAIEALRFVSLLGLLVGVAVVLQVQLVLSTAGQSHLLGPLIVMIVVRELAPVIVNLIVIGRSGTAIIAELGIMKVSGQVRSLDVQGLDPAVYLVMPRVMGMAVSVFSLTIVFVIVSLFSGYTCGRWWGVTGLGPAAFTDSVLSALAPRDAAIFLLKTLLPSALAGILCCIEGLNIEMSATEIPRAITRGFGRSVAALFVIVVGISILTYL